MPRQKKQRLKRRKDGRYCCVYHGVQFMGLTEEEALEKREEYKRRERLEEIIRENPTVREYADRWLPLHKVGIRENTHSVHKLHLDKLCAVIGDMYVRDVKPSHIKMVYTQKYAGLSSAYIAHAKGRFVALFDSAVADGIILTNPARSEAAKPHKGTEGSHRAITPEERRLIETAALDHRMHPIAILMLYSGLRPQEVKALRIDRDVDFKAGVIHVREFVHMASASRYVVDSTGKTKKATRDVPLFAPVREALNGIKGYLLSTNGELPSKKTWLAGWKSYQHAIEETLNGISRQRYTHQKKENRPPWAKFTVVPYDLRHSFVTWCRDNGVELHTCVEWMGHKDAKMIMRIYDEVSDSRSKAEAERLEKMLFHMQNDMQKSGETPGSGTE